MEVRDDKEKALADLKSATETWLSEKERAIAIRMIEDRQVVSSEIDKRSTWLLVGSAAVASVMVVNGAQITEALGVTGYRACSAALSLSCIFGLISREYARNITIRQTINKHTKDKVSRELEAHKDEVKSLLDGRDAAKFPVSLDVRMERILHFYASFLPWWGRYSVQRALKRFKVDQFIGPKKIGKETLVQELSATLQTWTFFAFLAIGLAFASITAARSAAVDMNAKLQTPPVRATSKSQNNSHQGDARGRRDSRP